MTTTPETSAREYFVTTQAVKAIGESGKVGGYLLAFGLPRDAHGEYFAKEAEFGLNWYPTRPILWHHGLEGDAVTIGVITNIKVDAFGIYAEGVLDINHEDPYVRNLARRAYDLVKAGKIGWSSGSLPHLVKVDDDGRITQWPIVEGSLTPTPAEAYRTNVQTIKSLTSALVEPGKEPPDGAGAKDSGATGARVKPIVYTIKSKRGVTMFDQAMIDALREKGFDAEQILTILSVAGNGTSEPDGMAAETEEEPEPVRMDEEDPYKADGEDDEETAVASKKRPGKSRQNGNRSPSAKEIADELMRRMKTAPAPELPVGGVHKPNAGKTQPEQQQPRIEVMSKFRDLSHEDMSFLDNLRKIAIARGKAAPLSTEFYREMADKALKAHSGGKARLAPEAYNALKAVDLQNTGEADWGGDWVPTLWTDSLWELARIDNNVASSLEVFEMPSPSYEYPIESDDPVVYAVDETDDSTADLGNYVGTPFKTSRMKTDKVTFNAKKLGLQVGFSAEIEEDSIIPFTPQLRTQALRTMQDAVDSVILNADATTGTANINYKGANTSVSPQEKFLYGGGDGFRHLALVDGIGLAIDLNGGVPTLAKFREARYKLRRSYTVRPSDLAVYVDPETYGKMLSIDELLVFMNNGRGSTVNDGVLTPTVDGVAVFQTEELALSDTDGFALADGSGTRGQIVMIHKPSWKVGYRRRVSSDVSYIPNRDAYVMTLTIRMALGRRDLFCASLIYNIGV